MELLLAAALLLAARVSAAGPHRVVGSPPALLAAPGDDVVLSCRVEPPLDVRRLTVEWSKPDLRPDPSDQLNRVDYVHMYRNRQEAPGLMIAGYRGRTALFGDQLERGNISLRLRNVTPADGGRYRCFIPKLRSKVRSAVIQLLIEPKGARSWTTETPQNPRDLQTPAPEEETDVEGGRPTSSIPLLDVLVVAGAAGVAVLAVLILGAAVVYFLKRKGQKPFPKYNIAPDRVPPA